MRKTVFLGLGRWILAATVVLFLWSLLDTGGTNAAFDEVCAQVCDCAALEQTKQADEQLLRRLYGLDAAEYDGYVLYYPATDMGVTELLLVRVHEPEQVQRVQTAMQTRLDTQTGVFAGYAPEQYALCQDGSAIVTQGTDVLFVISEQKDAVVRAFEAACNGRAQG